MSEAGKPCQLKLENGPASLYRDRWDRPVSALASYAAAGPTRTRRRFQLCRGRHTQTDLGSGL